MKASELIPNQYGIALEGILIIRNDRYYTVAYNNEVKRCVKLPLDIDVELKGSITNESYIIQAGSTTKLVSDEQLRNLIDVAVIKNKDLRFLTIARI